MTLTGVAFALAEGFWPLLLIALVGTLNPSAGDVSLFLPLEQARLARAVADRDRTALFARYSLVGSLAGAVGALCAGFPEILGGLLPGGPETALRAAFLLYAALGLACLLLYRRLPAEAPEARAPAGPLRRSRRVVLTLAALFSLDAFAGGLVVQSLLALWLLERFGLSLAATGAIFFWTGLLSALSQLAAAPVARRFGLVNTMVFTHLPANVCLVLVPFAPGPRRGGRAAARAQHALADGRAGAHLLRHGGGRARRAGGGGRRDRGAARPGRGRGSAAGRRAAGRLGFGWPLVVGGGLKIAYDLALLAMFGTSVRRRKARTGPAGLSARTSR
jgi:predicted MFS family arabinose efflux permease